MTCGVCCLYGLSFVGCVAHGVVILLDPDFLEVVAGSAALTVPGN